MSVSLLHVLEQGPVLRALGHTVLAAMRKPSGATHAPPTPGPWIEAELPPRSESLLQDYVRHVGGDPSAYRGRVPPHLFPQWIFPLGAKVLDGVPYDLTKALNAGCRIEVNGPLPRNESLVVRARLESIDDDGRRAILVQRTITGTKSAPEALVAETRALVPLAKKKGDDGASGARADKPKARPTVPTSAKELAFLRIGANAGLDFALLTGDFNPIHWVPAYARAAGFRGCILHGFSTFARALEALNRSLFAGDVAKLAVADVRFVKPLGLPAKVGVYVTAEGGLYVGDAPGGAAYMEGTFQTRAPATTSTTTSATNGSHGPTGTGPTTTNGKNGAHATSGATGKKGAKAS